MHGCKTKCFTMEPMLLRNAFLLQEANVDKKYGEHLFWLIVLGDKLF